MRHRSVERRVSLRPLATLSLAFSALALGVACSDDAGKVAAPGESTTTVFDPNAPQTTSTLPLDTPTTFIVDCGLMPTATALSAIVGIPLADGVVVGAGTCEFRGLNEQSRVITLGLLTDPGDQATFNDLQLSLGASVPLNDPTLVNALVDPSSLVYINTGGGIYTVRTSISDAAPGAQVPVSAAVLHAWLGV
ncbi:MAG: hypothetical protein ABL953_06235 [Ilumatobacteraceae bacterium]